VATYAYLSVGFRNYTEIFLFPDNYYNLFTFQNLVIHSILLCITYPFFYRFLCKDIKHAVIDIQLPAWKNIWIIPASFFFVIFIYTATYEGVYINKWQYITILSVTALVSFFVSYVSMNMLVQTDKNIKLEQQLELQREHYKMLHAHILETKRARHDLRHHLTVFQSFIDKGETEKLTNYVNEYRDSIPDDTEIVFCQNHAVNAILRYYTIIAKNEGIDVTTHLDLPDNTGLSDSDLCIVFGNCIENAIEACRKINDGKFIKLNSKITGEILAVTIDNSFDGVIKKEGNIFLSHKYKGQNVYPVSGIGISSVKSVIRKYKGEARFEAKGNVFQASVMLLLNVHDSNKSNTHTCCA
jgi:hypothetical protein